MKKFFLVFVLMIFPFVSFAASGNKTDETAASELTKLLSGISTMQADFVQFLSSEKRSEVRQETHGKMFLERPGKFRWEISKPTKQLIIADGKYAWIYDVDLEQVTKNKIDYNEAGNPAMLLSGSMETMRNIFKINKLESGDDDFWFQLRPKSENNAYQWIKLHFKKGIIVTMIMADNIGQKSEIDFSNVKIDTVFPSALFKFIAPKGVDILAN